MKCVFLIKRQLFKFLPGNLRWLLVSSSSKYKVYYISLFFQYIEKSRPIEHKLKYQMEKLLKIAASGGLSMYTCDCRWASLIFDCIIFL